jgi:hypothetical protein
VRLDSKPVYRRVILPWYDSEPLCIWVIIMMLAVFLFACAGVAVAGLHPFWGTYTWVPILLAVLSLWVLLSTSVRLIRRLMDKRFDESRL